MKTIKVTQSASEKIPPDSVVTEVRLVCESKKHADSVRELSEKSKAVMSELTAAGLEASEIKAGGVSVTAVRRDGKVVFCAQTRLKIALPISDGRTDGCIDAAERVGAQWSQSYVLSDKTYRDALVARAVEDARTSARILAEAAGVKLGALASIEYAASPDGGAYGGVRLMRASMAADISPEPEPIEASETVVCEWEID